MRKIIPGPVRGALSILLLVINTLFWCGFLFTASFLKMLLRFNSATRVMNRLLNRIAHNWIVCNNLILKATRHIEWTVLGTENLNRDRWYLVLANHQSWTDIVVLQKIFYGKIPFLKFFLKKELIWVPVLGIAWWALDFPFMKRYTPSFIEKHPHLKGKDIEITRRACAKFKHIPVSIMNFLEGTRFTPEKHHRQDSPYRNLLRPKSGGIGFVFSTMGEQISGILDVTIAYPGGPYSFWDFLCGRVKKIMVHVEELPVSGDLIGDYVNDAAYRKHFQQWLNKLWKDKDLKIDFMLDTEEGLPDMDNFLQPGKTSPEIPEQV